MFRFKQFTVRQDRTAMKVCTDACLLGAYADVDTADVDTGTPERADVETGTRLLDIGTGTGLLALMAAQRNPTARIDAVELDPDAAGQARDNVAASPFADRIQVFADAIQRFVPPADPKKVGGAYARILTNPPFYVQSLRSPDPAVNRALHADDLPFTELIAAVVRLLQQNGQWWVLLPPYEMDRLTQLAAAAGLHPFRRLWIRHHAHKPVFRVITGFGFGQPALTDETLAIYEPDNRTYTARFRALLEPFYLIF